MSINSNHQRNELHNLDLMARNLTNTQKRSKKHKYQEMKDVQIWS